MNRLLAASRVAGAAAAIAALVIAVVTPLDVLPQLAVGAAGLGVALLVRRWRTRFVTQLLTLLSLAASSRYIYWRLTFTLEFDTTLDRVLGLLLLGAELYAYAALLLGAFQTVRALPRRPAPLPADPRTWPTVDVFIPTYNEPLDVVRPSLLAALALDWPRDKLRVYLLDDGRRSEFRHLAAQLGARYLVRPSNQHAKAGNLNHALATTDGELIAIFDCDHVATRSFLQLSTGWFLRDPRLAMLQTPHHFYNADPIERNTAQFRRVPNEGELFYGHIQAGNDFWNASFFCGSCAVLRRSALDRIGGIATDSLTEDALTSLKLQRRGYRTAYLGVRQAAGLATETLAGHIGQRVRWAQGMTQILRISNPLLGRGLSLGQRLCYLNACLHFLYGLPRLVFLLGPLAYLLFGAHICNTSPAMLVAYLLPHLGHAVIADARTKGRFRYAFWNHVYETVLATYILVPTFIALLRPRAGVFRVTDKGVRIERGGFDAQVARPYLFLLLLNLAAVVFALARLFLWDHYDPGTVLINLGWSLFSLLMLGAALAVACERRQLRRTHRLSLRRPAMVRLPSGHSFAAEVRDLSLGGSWVQPDRPLELQPGAAARLVVFGDEGEVVLPARVVRGGPGGIGVEFSGLSLSAESALIQLLFGRPDAWLDWDRARPPDRPVGAMVVLARQSVEGMKRAVFARPWLASGAGAGIAAAAACFLLLHTGWRVQPLWDRLASMGQLFTASAAARLAVEGP